MQNVTEQKKIMIGEYYLKSNYSGLEGSIDIGITKNKLHRRQIINL